MNHFEYPCPRLPPSAVLHLCHFTSCSVAGAHCTLGGGRGGMFLRVLRGL